ncbi:efflux RND transporter periplasmic adaptor subunit [Hyphomicrobium sp.]|jgi:RND family efflux transporter MFP subunit|uniref:efflux RND transporter periplasmic adaptor subunit n=1 Tax=Hyphomicrobium sp. TaxID=82 RepID=UPI00356B60CB
METLAKNVGHFLTNGTSRRKTSVTLAAAALVSVGIAGCKPSEADPRTGVPLVRVATVHLASTAERSFTGVIAARVQSNLGFRVAGKIIERLVDTGQPVKAGQPLMKLDPVDLKLTIVAQNNAINAANATAIQARADEARYKNLVGQGWVSHQRYEQAKSALDSAEAQLAVAKANAQLARNAEDYSVLVADADGVVMETLSEPGQVVSAGQTVVRLAHSGPREGSVNLPETVRPEIGSEATATLYGDLKSRSPARLRQLSDAADPSTRTYEARYVLAGAAANAPLGATVTLHIPQLKTKTVVEVPVGAVVDNGASSGVWLLDQQKQVVGFRPVTLAGVGEETALISNGVQVGDQVVALGARLLHDGDSVRVEGEETASR